MTPTSTSQIDVALTQLDRVVAAARSRADRLGWFAAMYAQTTRTVRERVVAGRFDDGERMNRFVARFAGRYLAPFEAWQGGRPVPRCWGTAFGAADDRQRRDVVVLQHLLLGMNAHINLDLAVVAAEVSPGPEIGSLRADFLQVNEILGLLMPEVRACIGRFSPLLDVIDRVGGADDDQILNFSIRVARDEAWEQALLLADTDDPARRARLIDALDRRVAVLGKLIAHPGGLVQRAVDVVAATESRNVVKIMDALAQVTLPAR